MHSNFFTVPYSMYSIYCKSCIPQKRE